MFLPFQFPLATLIPDGTRIIWDSRKGFVISNATYKEIGLLTCETTVNGHLYQTNYLSFRQSKWRSKGVNINQNLKGLICLMKPSFKTMLFLVLAAYTVFDVQMSTPSPVKLLRGHALTLNCTATTPVNGRVHITWSYPGEVSDRSFCFFSRIVFIFSKWKVTVFLQWENQNTLTPTTVWVNQAALVGAFLAWHFMSLIGIDMVFWCPEVLFWSV